MFQTVEIILKAAIIPFLLLLSSFCCCSGQQPAIQSMVKRLKDRGDKQVLLSSEVSREFAKLDSAGSFKLLEQLQQHLDGNLYMQARLSALQAQLIVSYQMFEPFDIHPVESLYDKAVKKSIETNDELLIAEICGGYAVFCDRFELFEKAMFYILKSIGLQEKNGVDKFPDIAGFYLAAGDVLYKVGEYELCVQQLNKGISLLQSRAAASPLYFNYNTIGLAYYKQDKFDSAIYYYRRALPLTSRGKDTAWQGILTGNIGDVFFKEKKYDSAKYYLLKEFEITKNSTVEKRSPHNSMLTVARILAMQGRPDSGLKLIRLAEPVLFDNYFSDNRNLYSAKAEVFQAMKMYDSASRYSELFRHQDDSIKAKQVRSKMDVTLMKLNYEKSQHDIAEMLGEKKREKEKQYLLLAGILLAMIIGFVIYRQQRNRNRLEKALLREQKKVAEETSRSAREQLEFFTANIVEKNEMIEKLKSQLQQQHQKINEELLNQTILTDDDWMRFKMLFEKARPGFFEWLQQTAPGITPAELRLAALLTLKLDTKNIASMQGISADAVRKSKSRLRQRLNITVEDGLEDYINAISPGSQKI